MAIYAEEGEEPDWVLSGFDTFEEAFAALEEGTLDAVYAPRIHAEHASQGVGGLYRNSVIAKVGQLPTAGESSPQGLVQQLLGATQALASVCTRFDVNRLGDFFSSSQVFQRLFQLADGTFDR